MEYIFWYQFWMLYACMVIGPADIMLKKHAERGISYVPKWVYYSHLLKESIPVLDPHNQGVQDERVV
jgi:hypothetical protein